MAKSKTETAGAGTLTAVAVVEPKEEALAVVPQDLLDMQGAGTENIKASDVRPPRLSICQTGSAQFKKTEKHIGGIEEGDLFNSLSSEVYPRPLTFVVIQRLKTNYLQFDKENLGKVLDFDVAADDPRAKPSFKADGTWVKPVATQFDNYLVLLPDTFEVVSLSFKSTGLKAARQLDSQLKYPLKIGTTHIPNPPAWARTFTLDTTTQQGKGNSWATPKVTAAGVTDPQVRLAAASLYEQYKAVTVVVEHDESDAVTDAPDDTNIPF